MSYEVKNVSFSYGEHKVLSDVSFAAEKKELLCVLGSNGVGKTTLFKCMLGLLRTYQGEICVDGKAIKKLKPEKLARLVAYIPQSQASAFGYSVLDMVLMGTAAQVGMFSQPGKREREIALEALDRVGLRELANRNYLEISGGERQLTLVARALAQQAKVLVMDEPTSSLDYGNQQRVMIRMHELAKSGCTVILSTHNPEQALYYADRVLALHAGRVLACGKPQEVITTENIKKLYDVDVMVKQTDDRTVLLPESIPV